MKYEILIEKPARKFIGRLQPDQQKRILRAIYGLPDEGDRRPLSGAEGKYRLRVGGYRVIYTVDHGKLIVDVVSAGSRGDVYK